MKVRKGGSPLMIGGIALLVILSAGIYFFLALVQTRSYQAQPLLRIPEKVFTFRSWPLNGWHFNDENLVYVPQPEWGLKNMKGSSAPKLWNILMGCSSATDVTLHGMRGGFPSRSGDWVLYLRSLLVALSHGHNSFQKHICQSTQITAKNADLVLKSVGGADISIHQLNVKKTETPTLQLDGHWGENRPFGMMITYKPREDTAYFTSDFWQQAHFDGQIKPFSMPNHSFVRGAVHCPSSPLSLGNAEEKTLFIEGDFSISAEMSGELSDLASGGWTAETLGLEGAVDIRDGKLKPVNLAEDIVREAGTIPALTLLGKLLHEKALPKLFYADETPFDLLRFVISKAGESLELSRIVIKHSAYLAAGDGAIDPKTGALSFTGNLVFSDDLSQRLIQNVPRLRLLLSDGSRLAIPFKLEGSLSAPRAHADIPKITDKMIAIYREELVRRGNTRVRVVT